jgi:hypothetical protein
MKVSTGNKAYFIKEIAFAAKEMRAAQSPIDKLYFFSIVFGAANRIMNMEFDSELSFIHNVTNAAYLQIQSSLFSQGQMPNTIDLELFDKIANNLDEMAKNIADGEPTYKVLENISNLAYSTTGNGHYLVLRGKYKL